MKTAPALVAHCLELLSPLGSTRARSMFGGHGVYVDALFVALIANDTFYLKADAQAQPAFADAGCQPFTYSTTDGRRAVLGFWNAPDEAMESAAAMLPWARLAIDSALRAAAAKRPVAPTRPRRSSSAAPTPAKRRKAGG